MDLTAPHQGVSDFAIEVLSGQMKATLRGESMPAGRVDQYMHLLGYEAFWASYVKDQEAYLAWMVTSEVKAGHEAVAALQIDDEAARLCYLEISRQRLAAKAVEIADAMTEAERLELRRRMSVGRFRREPPSSCEEDGQRLKID